MTPIRFFTDEDVYGSVARRLREFGFEAVSTPEADRLGESDRAQFFWADQEGRVLLTFNVAVNLRRGRYAPHRRQARPLTFSPRRRYRASQGG